MTINRFATRCEGWSSLWATLVPLLRLQQNSSRPLEFAATDCLVADIHMPDMSGVELYRHLIETGRGIPTILVTAYPDDRVQERMLSEGVGCYLRKPLEEAALIDCLHSAVTRAMTPQH